MTLFEIAIAVVCAPVVLMFAIGVVYAIGMLIYGSWIFLFALLGNQLAKEKWMGF
jgi:hypothetical protein